MKISPETKVELEEMAYQIRPSSLEMIAYGMWGHIGGSFSMAEIFSTLYFHTLRVDPANPQWKKGTGSYCPKLTVLGPRFRPGAARVFSGRRPVHLLRPGRSRRAHRHEPHPWIGLSGGPLGMGLSVAVGMALGLRMNEKPMPRVFCILGDGESNEGNIWEAAMSAAHYHLDNLIVVVDYNKVMAKGFVWEEMSIQPFSAKWVAFGWNLLEVDGHDLEALADAFHQARYVLPNGKPVAIIAHTVKGRGVERAEFNYQWHTHAPDPHTADQMLRELARNYQRPEKGFSRLQEALNKEVFYGGE